MDANDPEAQMVQERVQAVRLLREELRRKNPANREGGIPVVAAGYGRYMWESLFSCPAQPLRWWATLAAGAGAAASAAYVAGPYVWPTVSLGLSTARNFFGGLVPYGARKVTTPVAETVADAPPHVLSSAWAFITGVLDDASNQLWAAMTAGARFFYNSVFPWMQTMVSNMLAKMFTTFPMLLLNAVATLITTAIIYYSALATATIVWSLVLGAVAVVVSAGVAAAGGAVGTVLAILLALVYLVREKVKFVNVLDELAWQMNHDMLHGLGAEDQRSFAISFPPKDWLGAEGMWLKSARIRRAHAPAVGAYYVLDDLDVHSKGRWFSKDAASRAEPMISVTPVPAAATAAPDTSPVVEVSWFERASVRDVNIGERLTNFAALRRPVTRTHLYDYIWWRLRLGMITNPYGPQRFRIRKPPGLPEYRSDADIAAAAALPSRLETLWKIAPTFDVGATRWADANETYEWHTPLLRTAEAYQGLLRRDVIRLQRLQATLFPPDEPVFGRNARVDAIKGVATVELLPTSTTAWLPNATAAGAQDVEGKPLAVRYVDGPAGSMAKTGPFYKELRITLSSMAGAPERRVRMQAAVVYFGAQLALNLGCLLVVLRPTNESYDTAARIIPGLHGLITAAIDNQHPGGIHAFIPRALKVVSTEAIHGPRIKAVGVALYPVWMSHAVSKVLAAEEQKRARDEAVALKAAMKKEKKKNKGR